MISSLPWACMAFAQVESGNVSLHPRSCLKSCVCACALVDPRKVLAPFDEHAHEFIKGNDAIATSAKFSPDHFYKRYLDVPSSMQVLSSTPSVLSCHTGLGHYYEVYGARLTHPSSASVWGQNARDLVAEERRARVPGWFGPSACPVSAGSVMTGLGAAAGSVAPATMTWPNSKVRVTSHHLG